MSGSSRVQRTLLGCGMPCRLVARSLRGPCGAGGQWRWMILDWGVTGARKINRLSRRSAVATDLRSSSVKRIAWRLVEGLAARCCEHGLRRDVFVCSYAGPRTPQPLCRLSFRIFQQAVRKIPCPVHDAFDTKGIWQGDGIICSAVDARFAAVAANRDIPVINVTGRNLDPNLITSPATTRWSG